MITVTVEGQQAQAEAALKRRKNGKDRKPAAVTGAHEAAEGHIDAMRDDADQESAAKNFRERGAYEGPGEPVLPGHPLPSSYDRMPLEAGHAAQSPQHEALRTDPVPLRVPGLLEAVALPGAPRAQPIDYRVTTALSGGSPSER